MIDYLTGVQVCGECPSLAEIEGKDAMKLKESIFERVLIMMMRLKLDLNGIKSVTTSDCPWILKCSTTNWHFEVWLKITFKENTIRCKKLATIVLGRKNVARTFIQQLLRASSILWCFLSKWFSTMSLDILMSNYLWT